MMISTLQHYTIFNLVLLRCHGTNSKAKKTRTEFLCITISIIKKVMKKTITIIQAWIFSKWMQISRIEETLDEVIFLIQEFLLISIFRSKISPLCVVPFFEELQCITSWIRYHNCFSNSQIVVDSNIIVEFERFVKTHNDKLKKTSKI